MARYAATGESQTAQLSGVNATTTVNGYMGYWGASATAGFRFRRVFLGVRAGASVPTSQQLTIALYRQTTAPAGTGLSTAVLGQALEIWTPQTDPTVGIIMTTATTIGTTAPVLATNPLYKWTFNTQTGWDIPVELLEECICNLGTANGLAFVNIGNTLPAAHLVTFSIEIEV